MSIKSHTKIQSIVKCVFKDDDPRIPLIEKSGFGWVRNIKPFHLDTDLISFLYSKHTKTCFELAEGKKFMISLEDVAHLTGLCIAGKQIVWKEDKNSDALCEKHLGKVPNKEDKVRCDVSLSWLVTIFNDFNSIDMPSEIEVERSARAFILLALASLLNFRFYKVRGHTTPALLLWESGDWRLSQSFLKIFFLFSNLVWRLKIQNKMSNKRRANARRGQMDAPDCISYLPDVILENILQRLSIRDAVRTTVLSSKWKDKWMTVQQLIFDENYRKPPSRRVILTNKFAGVVDNVLTQHRGEISRFKLSVLYLRAENSLNFIRRWVDLLSKKNIQELTIEVQSKCTYPGCDSLLACENLRVLKLKLGRLVVPDSSSEFKSLKELWLEGIAIDKDMNILLSKCPLLEKLTLVDIRMFPFEIDVKTVKCLDIRGFADFRIINAKSVTNFILHLSMITARYASRTVSSKLSSVLTCLPEVETLEVSSYSMEFLARGGVPMKLPIMLNKLMDMFLVVNFEDMDAVSTALSLLRSAPNLKRLQISARYEETLRNISADSFWKKEREYYSNLKHLKSLKLEQASCAKYEVEFIRYLVENSPEPEKMTINIGENGYNGEYKWVQGLAPHKRSMIEVLKAIK